MRKISTSLKAGFLLLAMLLSTSASIFAGSGTKEDPYTTADVITLDNPGTTVWVKAVIIGYFTNDDPITSGFNESHIYNVAISSDGGQTLVPVKISGNYRDELNLYDNPGNVGKEILLEGKLEEYFSKPGIKSITAYEWSDNTPPAVMTPTFSHANGTYETEQMVEIFCETEGAKIYYTIDETTPTSSSTLYTAPIAVSTTTTISAIAIKGEDMSAVSSCKLSFLAAEPMSIADFISNADKDNISTLNDVVVVHHANKNLYVKDQTGYLLIYNSTSNSYNPGDVISKIYGNYNKYYDLPQMINAYVPDACSKQDAPEPRPISIEDQSNLDLSDLSSHVKLVNETLTIAPDWTNGDRTNATLSSGKTLRNEFGLILNTMVDTPYDITCIVGVFKGNIQFYPIIIEVASTDVDEVTKASSIYGLNGKIYIDTEVGKEIDIYNITGQKIANKIAEEGLNTIEVELYSIVLVKVGNKVQKVVL